MTTRAGLRQLVRNELNDNAAVKLWADGLLNEYVNEAIRVYGGELPREVSATITVVANQAAYALPADLDRVVRVEQPKDSLRYPLLGDRGQQAQGELIDFEATVRRAGVRSAYRLWASQIILDPIPTSAGANEDIRLEYLARYAEPALDGDVLATPASDDDILVRLVAALALQQIATDEAKRQRFERQRGVSAIGEASAYERAARGRMALRKRRIRSRTLELM